MRSLLALRRAVDRHPFASDAALALAVAAIVQFDVLSDDGYLSASNWVYVPTTLLMTLPLAWRRRAPLVVVAVVMGALVVEALAAGSSPTPDTPLIAWLLAIYTVAAHRGRVGAVVGGAIGLVAGTVWIGLDDVFFPVVVFGGAWLAGRLVRQRQEHAVAIQERADALVREREANARAAVADERTRIARELHDVVAHTLGVIVVQAGAERLHVRADAPAYSTLASIERSGREALEEMGRLLGMLRTDGGRAALVPQPGLGRLDELLDHIRAAGVDVELEVEGTPRALGAGADVSAYRIVQEALTNTVRHSGSSRARLRLRWDPSALEIEVADDGVGPPAEPARGGHGLLGIGERVALYGGALVTGRSDLGGYLLVARLLVPA